MTTAVPTKDVNRTSCNKIHDTRQCLSCADTLAGQWKSANNKSATLLTTHRFPLNCDKEWPHALFTRIGGSPLFSRGNHRYKIYPYTCCIVEYIATFTLRKFRVHKSRKLYELHAVLHTIYATHGRVCNRNVNLIIFQCHNEPDPIIASIYKELNKFPNIISFHPTHTRDS